MRTIITHALRENRDVVLKKSRRHCHVRGLHSVVLYDAPRIIRLFVADASHDLWKNHPDHYKKEGLSLGFHAHHCNLSLHTVQGTPYNWLVSDVTPVTYGRPAIDGLWLFNYRSKLRGEEPGFDLIEKDCVLTQLHFTPIHDDFWLYAEAIHSVYVPRFQAAAWLVFEGQENPNYQPFTYSTEDLTKADMKGLYEPYSSIKQVWGDIGELI